MTNEAIIKWHEEGARQGYAFMLIVEDLETGLVQQEYYPSETDIRDVVKDYEREEGFRRMYVHGSYSLRSPIEPQISDGTPWHFDL